jgi:hypothetical protein
MAVEVVDGGVLRRERGVEPDLERHVPANGMRSAFATAASESKAARCTPGWILSRS